MMFSKSVVIFFVLTILTPWIPGNGASGQANACPIFDKIIKTFLDIEDNAVPPSAVILSQERLNQVMLEYQRQLYQLNQLQQANINSRYVPAPVPYGLYPPSYGTPGAPPQGPNWYPTGPYRQGVPYPTPAYPQPAGYPQYPCSDANGNCKNHGSEIAVGSITSGQVPVYSNILRAPGSSGSIGSEFGNSTPYPMTFNQ